MLNGTVRRDRHGYIYYLPITIYNKLLFQPLFQVIYT
jgi:hypothetical protein